MTSADFDQVWESKIYSQGNHLNLYPFDSVVTFVFRHRPREKNPNDTRIVELGCGSANNLWFAAREGFNVSGIDGSKSAISFAKKRFEDENLSGDLRVGSFLKLPWESDSFDLGIDRGSLVCVNRVNQKVAVNEMHRVLKPGGVFLSCGYSNKHTSASSGIVLEDGRTTDIKCGTSVGLGTLCFNSKEQVYALFEDGWEIISMNEIISTDLISKQYSDVHAEWRVIARKL